MRAIPLLVCLFACTDPPGPDDEWGMEGPVEPLPPPGKEDSQYRKGLYVATNTTRTQVWTARNKWEDTETAAARAAGLTWGANSGLTWDQKFAAWVDSLEWIPAVDNYSTTVRLTTPWGKTLPSPYLECAEMALFMRITFAAWYELPLQFEAVSSGQRVYFGHYGVRTATGRFAATPEFAIAFRDHSASTTWRTTWPKDATLRTRRLWGGTDEQPELGPSHVFGAYVDELHSARERRETAFRALYQVSAQHFGKTSAQVDDEYRELEDYVFGELEYTRSKTCCWNSTTPAMYDLIVTKAAADKAAADARMVCEAPVVFASRGDGYKRWSDYAASLGRASEWRAWSEDEACPQKHVAADTIAALSATPYCSL
jgi:hypothetical protein